MQLRQTPWGVGSWYCEVQGISPIRLGRLRTANAQHGVGPKESEKNPKQSEILGYHSAVWILRLVSFLLFGSAPFLLTKVSTVVGGNSNILLEFSPLKDGDSWSNLTTCAYFSNGLVVQPPTTWNPNFASIFEGQPSKTRPKFQSKQGAPFGFQVVIWSLLFGHLSHQAIELSFSKLIQHLAVRLKCQLILGVEKTKPSSISYGRIHGKTVYLPTFTININHPCR